ncbi:hypothetical protein, partial [Bradyrhizobium sp. 182]|uniref:hypothetical protein n=1 Tax=Bradyrhizobium sp. 182 TaxID=2782651 RepID=UPI001FF893BD
SIFRSFSRRCDSLVILIPVARSEPGVTPSPRADGVNHPDRAIQSIPRKSSPGTGDPIVTLTAFRWHCTPNLGR